MTHKDKAAELLMKFQNIESLKDFGGMDFEIAKQCAIISVDEIIHALLLPPIANHGHMLFDSQLDYWQSVKSELEKM